MSVPSHRLGSRAAPAVAAAIACGAFFAASLLSTPGGVAPAPDSLHYANVARNLLRGNGFQVDIIEYHIGLREDVRHIPEHHGMLRPLALAPIFAAYGEDPALLRAPGLAYLALTGFVGFLLARRLFGIAAGAVALLLILGDHLLWVAALNGSDDMGFAFFCLCALAALERGLRGGGEAWFVLAGLAAGFGLLEKQIGVFLPAVLALPLLAGWRSQRSTALRRSALAFAPFTLCLALYVVRNQLSYGHPGFLLYPMHLVFHVGGPEGLYRLFPATLAPGEVMAMIGPANVAAFAVEQLGVFAREVVGLPLPGAHGNFPRTNLLIALGFASLALLARAQPRFCLLWGACALGGLAFVAGLWHVYIRFFAFLVPLAAVALAGALALAARGVGAGAPRAALRAAALCAAVLPLLAGASVARTFATALSPPPGSTPPSVCADALAWLRSNASRDARVLSLDPWAVAWHAERRGIMAPAGGVAPIARVVRHYGARYLLDRDFPQRGATRRALRAFAAQPPADLRAQPVFDGAHCDVIALAPTSDPQTASATPAARSVR